MLLGIFSPTSPPHWGLLMLALGIVLAFLRLLRGPTLPDRVVALDLIGLQVMGASLVYAVDQEQAYFVDVAIVVAVVSFMGTVAFAHYLERRAQP